MKIDDVKNRNFLIRNNFVSIRKIVFIIFSLFIASCLYSLIYLGLYLLLALDQIQSLIMALLIIGIPTSILQNKRDTRKYLKSHNIPSTNELIISSNDERSVTPPRAYPKYKDALMVAFNLDDPYTAHEVTLFVAMTLRQEGYTVQPARPLPDDTQPIGGSLLAIGQQVLNKDFYIAEFNAIMTIAKVLHERRHTRVTVQQGVRVVAMTDDEATNEALLRNLIVGDVPVTVTVTDQE
jgi:hypothetical protein